jgi:cell division protein FtsW
LVYSSSIALPDGPKYAKYSSSHFLIRHAISIVIAFTVGVLAFKVPLKVWDRLAPAIFALAFIMLIFVLIPGVGKGVNGAKRWIPLGITNFQPSELMKLAVVLFAAWYTVQRQEYLHTLVKGLLPMGAAVIAVGVLLLLQPDMGAFMVIAVIAMGILFLGGINAKLFGALTTLAIASFASIIIFSEFRRQRIFAYLDPWNEEFAAGKAYQLTHSLMAFGRGEWFGVGLGGSIEKLHYSTSISTTRKNASSKIETLKSKSIPLLRSPTSGRSLMLISSSIICFIRDFASSSFFASNQTWFIEISLNLNVYCIFSLSSFVIQTYHTFLDKCNNTPKSF